MEEKFSHKLIFQGVSICIKLTKLCAGEIRELCTLVSEIIYHEVEKILFEETSRDLLAGVSGASVPSLQDLVFIG